MEVRTIVKMYVVKGDTIMEGGGRVVRKMKGVVEGMLKETG